MPRYIDADLLWDKISRAYQFEDKRGVLGYIKQCLNEAPTADVQEVKHGHWIMVRKTKLIPTGYMAVVEGHVLTKTGADKPFTMQEANIIQIKEHRTVKIPYCPICGDYGDDESDATLYCPHCGARMDGGENDETDV